MSDFRARDAKIFRPYADEIPWELLESAGPDEGALRAVLERDLVRVAKYQDRVIGAYGIQPLTPTCYELVTLAVEEGYRRKGLGRWLLGHAIGLAESRGAREILVRGSARRLPRETFLSGVGFVADGDDLRLVLQPE